MAIKTRNSKPVVSRSMMNVPGLAINIRKGELHSSDLLVEGGELIEAYASRNRMSDLYHAAAILALSCLCVERPEGLPLDWYTRVGAPQWVLGNAAVVLRNNAKIPARVAEEALLALKQLDSGICVSHAARLVNDVVLAFKATKGFGCVAEREAREVKSLCPCADEKCLRMSYARRLLDHAFRYLKDEAAESGDQYWYTGVANMRPRNSRYSYRELYKMECRKALDNLEKTLAQTGEHDNDEEEDDEAGQD